MKNDLSIIGSGLTGPLLSTILAKQCNLHIDMFERSDDSRILNNFSGRSIIGVNLRFCVKAYSTKLFSKDMVIRSFKIFTLI